MARVAALVAGPDARQPGAHRLGGRGHDVEPDTTLPDELDGVDLVVADLDAVPPEQLAELDIPVIGFYQHTDTEMKARAEAAGLFIAVPRSRMVRELPELVERALA